MGLYRQHGSNVWWMSFTADGRRFRLSTGTDDRKKATAIYGKVQAEIVEHKWFDKDTRAHITLRELADRYLKKYNRQRDHVSMKHLLVHFGEMRLTDIDEDSVENYIEVRTEEGAKLATVYQEFALGRRMFNVARKKWGKEILVGENPFANHGFPTFDNARDRWLTVEEEKRLLEASSPEWVKDVIVFAIHTGCRRGEILQLHRSDVDMARRVITIQSSKGGTKKVIPMSQRLYEMLQRRLRVVNINGKVFDVTVSAMKDAFCRAVEKAGLENFHFHDLRHTFGTRLVQSGVDLYRVQKLMGHKTVRMTERYAHHSPESLRPASEALDKYYDCHSFVIVGSEFGCAEVRESSKINAGSV